MNDDDDDDDLQKIFLASVHTHLYKQIQSSRCQRLLLSLPKYTRNRGRRKVYPMISIARYSLIKKMECRLTSIPTELPIHT